MRRIMKTNTKVAYSVPQIFRVELDSDISLTLDSMTPVEDPESLSVDALSNETFNSGLL